MSETTETRITTIESTEIETIMIVTIVTGINTIEITDTGIIIIKIRKTGEVKKGGQEDMTARLITKKTVLIGLAKATGHLTNTVTRTVTSLDCIKAVISRKKARIIALIHLMDKTAKSKID